MIGTSGGIPVTDKLIEELADQAERGYTDDQLGPNPGRRGGSTGRATSPVTPTRYTASWRESTKILTRTLRHEWS